MLWRSFLAFLFASLLVTASFGQAQNPHPEFGSIAWSTPIDVEHDPMLLLHGNVQRDLGLDTDTIALLMRLDQAANDAATELYKGVAWQQKTGEKFDYDAALKRYQDLRADFERRSFNLLTPSQRRRWYQLTLQARGVDLLDGKTAIEELKLTKDQIERIRKQRMVAYTRYTDAVKGSVDKDVSDRAEKDRKQDLETIATTVLNKQQLKHWREMFGPPLADQI